MKKIYIVCSSIIVMLISLLLIIGYNHINNKEDKIINDKLVFEVYSKRIKCKAVKLMVYSDFTYEYIYSNKESIKGTYKVDAYKVIENNKLYSVNNHGYYILIDKYNNQYQVFDTNEDLNKLLAEININLDTCMQENSGE